MNDIQVQNSADIITRVFNTIDPSSAENSNKMISSWKKIVGSIHDCGQNLADHSRIIDLKNGILLVETDHPGWTQLLQLHKKYILKGLHTNFPQLKIDSLAFRLAGSSVTLSYIKNKKNEEAKKQFIKGIEEEEIILKKKGFGNENPDKKTEKEALPDDLKNLFDSLKQTMLTNTRK